MPRTLSANVNAGKGGSSNPVWLLQMESSAGVYYFATETFVDGLTTYYGNRLLRKSGLGKIKQEIRLEEGGAFEETTEQTIQLGNADLYSDSIMSAYFENRRVEVRLIFADKAGASWNSGTQIFFGYVNETPQFDFEKITFKCTRGMRKWNRKLPPNLLTESENPLCPSNNIGQCVPIIFGDWTLGNGANKGVIASNISPNSDQIIHRDYFKILLTRKLQGAGDLPTNNATAAVACHSMNLFPPDNQDPYKFLYDDAARAWHRIALRYATVDGYVAGRNFTLSCYVENPGEYKVRRFNRIVPDLFAATSHVTNPEHAIDEDDSNATVLEGVGEYIEYAVPFDFETTDIISLKVYWKIALGTGNVPDDILTWEAIKEGEVSPNGTCPQNTDFNYADLTTAWADTVKSGSIGGIRIRFTYNNLGQGGNGTFSIYSVFVEVVCGNVEVRDCFFDTGKGLPYGSWIVDENKPDPAFSEDDVIENPAYAIEALLIVNAWIGATVTDIALTEFDTVATDKQNWKLARELLEQEDLFDLIREICYEFGFGCFLRSDGKFCVRRIRATGDAVATLTKNDMAYLDGSPSLKIERGSLKNLYNDFILRYKVNMDTGQPEKMMYVRAPNGDHFDSSYSNIPDPGQAEVMWQMCHSAYENFQQINLWEYTAKWIRDDATAELFLEFMIELLTRVPYKVIFSSALDLIGLELLDEYKISHDLLPATISGLSRFRLVEQEIDPATDMIKNVFWEVV